VHTEFSNVIQQLDLSDGLDRYTRTILDDRLADNDTQSVENYLRMTHTRKKSQML